MKMKLLITCVTAFAASLFLHGVEENTLYKPARSVNYKGERRNLEDQIPHTPRGGSATINDQYFLVTKTAPAKVAVGETFDWVYTVRTKHQPLDTLTIEDVIPAGFEYVSSSPKSEADGKPDLHWTLKDLAANDTRTVRATLKAKGQGTHSSCFTASATPHACLATEVGLAKIDIDKSGPSKAVIGDRFSYTVTVKNTGNLTAHDVVVTDKLPKGLKHASGQSSLRYNIGSLAPGASETITIPVTAAEGGKHCNSASVSSDNAGSDSDDACTVVAVPDVSITKTGDKKQFIGKTADYDVTVKNDGDLTLKSLIVKDTAPSGTRIVRAEGASVSGNTATWRLDSLAAGKSKKFNLTLTSATSGERCNNASVTTARGLSDSDSACTKWVGVPAILLELVDVRDALLVGDSVDYVIRITNQGSAPDRNVSMIVDYPKGLKPVSATGASKATVSGQKVTFQPYATLNPQQMIEYRVSVKATGTGDHRVKGTLDSDHTAGNEVVEIESTTVY